MSRLLTIDAGDKLRTEWRKLDENTRISWRDYWLQAQADLTSQSIFNKIEKLYKGKAFRWSLEKLMQSRECRELKEGK